MDGHDFEESYDSALPLPVLRRSEEMNGSGGACAQPAMKLCLRQAEKENQAG